MPTNGEEKTHAFAKVSLTVEVVCSQPWAADETVANVWKAAAREAIERLTNIIGKHAGEVRILSEPVVAAVIAPEKR